MGAYYLVTKKGYRKEANKEDAIRAFREIETMDESISIETDAGMLRVTGPVGDQHLVQLYPQGTSRHLWNEFSSDDVEQILLAFFEGGRLGTARFQLSQDTKELKFRFLLGIAMLVGILLFAWVNA